MYRLLVATYIHVVAMSYWVVGFLREGGRVGGREGGEGRGGEGRGGEKSGGREGERDSFVMKQ